MVPFRVPRRNLANLVAGGDEPVLMNSLFKRILSDEERLSLQAEAIQELVRRYDWLKPFLDMTAGSDELMALTREQSAKHGYMLTIVPFE